MIRRLSLSGLLFLLAGFTSNTPATASEADIFQTQVLPLLEARCFECHDARKQTAGLRLDLRRSALAGGESGTPAVVTRSSIGRESPLLSGQS